jgi:hypothetical protein
MIYCKPLAGLLLTLLVGTMVGCTSTHLLPDGSYLYQFKAEQRSPFGTNTTVTRAATCPQDLTTLQDWTPAYTEAVKQCKWLQSEWHDAASQGQGGQVAAGALQGVGLGVAGALIGNGSASATATAGAVATGGKGH